MSTIEQNENAYLDTLSGHKFFYSSMTNNVWSTEEIATVLSRICRYGGHTVNFYSVAQHSVLLARLAKWFGYDEEMQLVALLHDVPEVYIGDIIRPLKEHLGYSQTELAETEARIWEWICKYHCVDDGLLPIIENLERGLYYVEMRDLIKGGPRKGLPEMEHPPISCWTMEVSRETWKNNYRELVFSLAAEIKA